MRERCQRIEQLLHPIIAQLHVLQINNHAFVVDGVLLAKKARLLHFQDLVTGTSHTVTERKPTTYQLYHSCLRLVFRAWLPGGNIIRSAFAHAAVSSSSSTDLNLTTAACRCVSRCVVHVRRSRSDRQSRTDFRTSIDLRSEKRRERRRGHGGESGNESHVTSISCHHQRTCHMSQHTLKPDCSCITSPITANVIRGP